MMRLSFCLALLLLVQVSSISNAQAPPRASHALLIGISDYAGSTGVKSLMGPPNDIALVQDVLRKRFGVADKNIVTLLEKQATHSAIQKAFEELAARVKEGDFVYIHYSGHGSTRENKNGRGGYDQTWVTYGSRNKNFSAPDNRDVLDKEINLWLQPLYRKAHAAAKEKKDSIDIVFVSDSCHSGTMARRIAGDGVTNVREVNPDPAPYPQIIPAESSSSLPGVRIGAARDTESAIELDPRNGKECKDPKHCTGVFTWHWVRALHQAKPGEQWGDVFKRSFTMVTADRYSAQRPQQEGHAERPIFGGAFAAPSLTVAVTEVDATKGTARLGAGAASGVSKGSVYRLYTATNGNHGDVPELEVTDASEATTSEAKLLSGTVQVGDLVTEVRHAYQFNSTRLYVSGDFAKDLDQPLIQAIQGPVSELADFSGFQLVPDRAHADLLLYVLHPKKNADGQYVHDESTRQRLPQSFRTQPPEVWVVTPQDQVLHDNMRISFSDMQEGMRVLQKNLQAFARAREVRGLNAPGTPPRISVQVSVLRPDAICGTECRYAPSDMQRTIPHRKISSYELGDACTIVQRGDSITFSIQNKDRQLSWYVYLLNIAPDGTVNPIFPTGDDIQERARLKGGEGVDLDALKEEERAWLQLNDLGVETVKLIVSRNPIDVQLLENRGGYERKGDLNPLERLLRAAGRGRRDNQALTIDDWGTLQADYEVHAE
jgi:hypothetical protein